MTVQSCLLQWLERLPAMAALAPDGLCAELTGASGTRVDATLSTVGCECRAVSLAEVRDEVYRCRLSVRAAPLTHGAREAFLQQCEDVREAICAADAAEMLPDLQAANACAQGIQCGPALVADMDDSGFLTVAMALELAVLR